MPEIANKRQDDPTDPPCVFPTLERKGQPIGAVDMRDTKDGVVDQVIVHQLGSCSPSYLSRGRVLADRRYPNEVDDRVL